MQKNKERPDGRVQAKVSIGNGKYKYVYASSNKELNQKVQEVRTKLGKGLDVSAERDTFEQWGLRWLKLKKTEVSTGRYVTYTSRFKNLAPIYYMPISKIRTSDIQDIIIDLATMPNERTGKPMAKKTLIDVRSVASQTFALAIDNRVIDYNPATSVKIPKSATATTKRALTDEEQQWIVNTPHRCQTAAMIMMYAGLRRGELIPLTWQDIDLSEGTITINKTVEFINGKPNIKPTGKTVNSLRTIVMPKQLIDYLTPLQKGDFALVCPSANGKLMSDSSWKRLWESYLTDLNLKYGNFENNIEWMSKHSKEPTSKYQPDKPPFVIPRFTAHWLRHTYITLLYMAGVDVLTAMQQAGHADIKTTVNLPYGHI